MKTYADQRNHAKKIEFKVGDCVLIQQQKNPNYQFHLPKVVLPPPRMATEVTSQVENPYGNGSDVTGREPVWQRK